jgi:threonine dehydrogenase-like Zn-dependent dehydrogenase
MKALRFSRGVAEFREMPEPRPQPGQALLRPTLAGICQTDLELLAGYYQFQGVAGHEFVARVEEAPGNQDLVGARVVADINIGCGSCPWCRSGDPRHCRARACIGIHDWPGAFAELLLAPAVNLHVLPESLSDRRAVFAEPLAAALEISQQVHLTAGLRALVLGDGRLGLLAALGLRHQMPKLTLAGKHPANLEIAGRAGVRTYLMGTGNADQALADLGLFDLVVEATGSPQGAEQSLLLTRPEGTVVLKTTSHEPSQINLAKVVVDEITLLGSRCGDLGLALNFLQNGLVDPEPLVGSTYSFDQLPQALEQAARPDALKVLVEY